MCNSLWNYTCQVVWLPQRWYPVDSLGGSCLLSRSFLLVINMVPILCNPPHLALKWFHHLKENHVPISTPSPFLPLSPWYLLMYEFAYSAHSVYDFLYRMTFVPAIFHWAVFLRFTLWHLTLLHPFLWLNDTLYTDTKISFITITQLLNPALTAISL